MVMQVLVTEMMMLLDIITAISPRRDMGLRGMGELTRR